MGWMQRCLETYENNAHMVGKIVEGKEPLAPMFFITQKAQIEVTLTEEGRFYGAARVSKEDERTLIPATEDSGSRSSNTAAHPLCDQLQYIALGNETYSGCKAYHEKYEKYLQELAAWAQSPQSHYIVWAVYRYCLGGTMISDLTAAGIITVDETGKLRADKINGAEYEKCLVRWKVLKAGYTGGAAWTDETLFKDYRDYRFAQADHIEKTVCYVKGELAIPAKKHPKGTIRNTYGAILISANDSENFTYRGRFDTPEQAYSVGLETTQKAHAALRWLVENQGANYGGRTFICFNPKGKEVPKPDPGSMDEGVEDDPQTAPLTMPEYQKKIEKALAGYREDLGDNEDVVLISLDAATTGRLSVTYYNELKSSDFLDRLQNWYKSCCWYRTRFTPEKKPYLEIYTPGVKSIVNAAFGTEQGGMLKADDKVVREQAQRLLHCVIDEQPVPYDIVRALVNRTSMPQAYSRGNFERILSIACALIQKYENERRQGDVWTMELDKKSSYWFGQLLAVAEKVERSTYNAEDAQRQPNAIRYWSAFVKRPNRTWAKLEEKLIPYYKKLNIGSREYYKKLTGQITERLLQTIQGEKGLNEPLDDSYLFGYYLKRMELNRGKTEQTMLSEQNGTANSESDTNENI